MNALAVITALVRTATALVVKLKLSAHPSNAHHAAAKAKSSINLDCFKAKE